MSAETVPTDIVPLKQLPFAVRKAHVLMGMKILTRNKPVSLKFIIGILKSVNMIP